MDILTARRSELQAPVDTATLLARAEFNSEPQRAMREEFVEYFDLPTSIDMDILECFVMPRLGAGNNVFAHSADPYAASLNL